MNFAGAEKIAAAILYEGYILYPYRPTAVKNRQRWNFGTLYPRVYAEAQRPAEPFRLVAECLAVADANARVEVRVSFLQLMRTHCSLPVRRSLLDRSFAGLGGGGRADLGARGSSGEGSARVFCSADGCF